MQTDSVAESETKRPKGRTVRLWASRGSATMVDQLLQSGSNYALGALIGRTLGPVAYGSYSLFLLSFLLLANLHQALVIEPMFVFAPKSYGQRYPEYLGKVIRLHVVVSTLVIAALWFVHLGAVAMGKAAQTQPLLALIPTFPCVLLLWILRGGAYLRTSPWQAASASIVYCVALTSGLLILLRTHQLSTTAAFVLMCVSSLAASAVLLLWLKPVFRWPGGPTDRQVGREHWQYGRWSIASVMVNWVQGSSLPFWIGLFLGTSQVGIYTAVLSCVLPMGQALNASARLLLPYLSGLAARQGLAELYRRTIQLTAIAGGATLLYWIVLSIAARPLFTFVFGQKFAPYVYLVPAATFYLIFWAAMLTIQVALRAAMLPQLEFKVLCAAATISTAISVGLLPRIGLYACFIGMTASSLTGLVLGLILLRKRLAHVPHEVPTSVSHAERQSGESLAASQSAELTGGVA